MVIPVAGSDGAGPVEAVVEGFVDVGGSGHREDIIRIAELGITQGCATEPEFRFCPEDHVTRAEMAAFLLRAVGQSDPQPSGANPFSDVADGVWYTNYAVVLAELGVDAGEGGVWRPDDPLTRLEMARWLTAMFDQISAVAGPEGLFGDVDATDWPVVEGLYEAGVTKGCSANPLLYCPDKPVTREQMASFIVRSLD